MNIIQNNPYRIAGILSSASAKELQKQKGKIIAFSKVGKVITSDLDFDILSKIERTEQSIEKAFSNIKQNQDKVNNSLFWFVKTNKLDENAIKCLIDGSSEKALDFWSKMTVNKDVKSNTFSAFNNIGTLKLLSNSKTEIKQGIEAKIKLIKSEYFEKFVHSVAGQTFTIDNKKQSQILIDELLILFKNQYSSTDLLELFSNCDNTIQNYLSKKFTEEPLHNIESSIELAKRNRNKDKSDGYSLGKILYKDTKNDLVKLKTLLSRNDLNFKMISDRLSKELMQCGIDYYNECKDQNNDHLNKAMELVKLAKSIAQGKFTIDKAKDNLISLEEMKEREISQAIEILQSIKDAFETNERQFLLQVRNQEASMGYGESINWTKVNELIKNCIDWDEAIGLIVRLVPKESILKIKNTQDTSKVNKYKTLVGFVFEKTSYSNKNRINYLAYWSVSIPRPSQPRSPTVIEEFDFSKNAWWIFAVVGIIIGLMFGAGWFSLIIGLGGAILGGSLND